jgi:hypothetical protein
MDGWMDGWMDVAHMGEVRNSYKFFIRKLEEKHSL